MKDMLADALILLGVGLLGHAIYRVSPIGAEFYASAVVILVGLLVLRK